MNEVDTKIGSQIQRCDMAENSDNRFKRELFKDESGKDRRVFSEVSLRVFRSEVEMQAISNALRQTGWNRKRAARLLRISYRGLLYKIRRHKITPPDFGPAEQG